MFKAKLLTMMLICFAAAVLSGGASASGTAPACRHELRAGPADASSDDPFSYCARVGTIDSPGGQYTGPPMPDSVIQAMIRQGIVRADAPLEFQKHAVWRCMDNSVWVCVFGANIPCLERADTSRTPTPSMERYCREDAAAKSIPAYVTGRATVYEWGCGNGKPEVIRRVLSVDPQGYLADFWHKLSPEGGPKP